MKLKDCILFWLPAFVSYPGIEKSQFLFSKRKLNSKNCKEGIKFNVRNTYPRAKYIVNFSSVRDTAWKLIYRWASGVELFCEYQRTLEKILCFIWNECGPGLYMHSALMQHAFLQLSGGDAVACSEHFAWGPGWEWSWELCIVQAEML